MILVSCVFFLFFFFFVLFFFGRYDTSVYNGDIVLAGPDGV
jgi:hypothetical protein